MAKLAVWAGGDQDYIDNGTIVDVFEDSEDLSKLSSKRWIVVQMAVPTARLRTYLRALASQDALDQTSSYRMVYDIAAKGWAPGDVVTVAPPAELI